MSIWTEIVPTRFGPMAANPHDQYVGRSLIEYGEFSPAETRFLCGLLRPGDIVVEAGANVGAITIPMAQVVGEAGVVIAYEPQRFVHYHLVTNVALNNLTNVRVSSWAVGAGPSTIGVPALRPTADFNFGGVGLREIPLEVRKEQTPVVPLDALELKALRLLKADVEGMEAEVIAGAKQTIRKHQPLVYVEADRPPTQLPLFEALTELGYRLFWHLPPLYSPDNWRRNPVNHFGQVVSINWLGLPPDTGDEIAAGLRPVVRENLARVA